MGPSTDSEIMKDKDKKIIQRFIDGEKQLHSKLMEIEIGEDSIDIYADYLNAYRLEDMPAMFAAKKAIKAEMPALKLKPHFEKRKK